MACVGAASLLGISEVAQWGDWSAGRTGSRVGSMSSIKRDVKKKKLRLDRRREDLFLDIQPTVCKSASRFEREVLVVACLPSLWGSSADGDDANRVWKG
jgi:hypothetical protein